MIYRITNETNIDLSLETVMNIIKPGESKDTIFNIFDDKTISSSDGSLQIINEYNECSITPYGRLDYKIEEYNMDNKNTCREIIVTLKPIEAEG